LKNHIKVYLEHHGYKALYFEDLFIPCIWCGKRAVDVHHVDGRGRGGSKLKDTPDNLVALCRECHLKAEAKKISKEEIRERMT